MENKDLKDLMVAINIANSARYQEVALFVDKKEFLEKIAEIRKKLNITRQQIISANKKLSKSKPWLWELDYRKWIKDNPNNEEKIENEISEMIDYFKCPYYFRNIIKEVILFGNATCYIPDVEVIGPKTKIYSPFVAIIPNLKSKDKDILKAFSSAKYILKHAKEFRSIRKPPDLHPNLWKYRSWYWLRILSNWTYDEIANFWGEEYPEDETVTYLEVLKGVRLYKRLLQK
jgi:malate synthase